MSLRYVVTDIPPVGTRYSIHAGSWIYAPITLEPKPITRPGDTNYHRNLLVYVWPVYNAGAQLPDNVLSTWISLGTETGPDSSQVWVNPYLYCNPVNIAVPGSAQTAAITYHFWFDFRLDAAWLASVSQISFVVKYHDYGLDANPLLTGKVVV